MRGEPLEEVTGERAGFGVIDDRGDVDMAAYRLAIRGHVQFIAELWHTGGGNLEKRPIAIAADMAHQLAMLVDWLIPAHHATPVNLFTQHIVGVGAGQFQLGAECGVMVAPVIDRLAADTRTGSGVAYRAALSERLQEYLLRLEMRGGWKSPTTAATLACHRGRGLN